MSRSLPVAPRSVVTRSGEEKFVDLDHLASQLPSMGGTDIGPLLRQVTRDAPGGTSIVEVGCWLGAGTAQLALGIRERDAPGTVSLHCYDRWEANEAEVEKAARAGVTLSSGQDTLSFTEMNLEPFGVPVRFHKADIRDAQWNGGPISVYVDDVSKLPRLFYHSLVTFGPSWIPGQTVVVFMDYHIWKVSGVPGHRCQMEFVAAHGDCFESIEYDDPTSTVAVFLYKAPINFSKWVVATLLSSLDATAYERRMLVGGLRRADKKIRQSDDRIRHIHSSTSWRVTAPLRRCTDGVRGIFGRGDSSKG